MSDTKYRSVKSTAKDLDVSVRTVWSWIGRDGDPLPNYKIGGRVLIRTDERDQWLEQFRRGSQRAVGARVRDLANRLAGVRK